MTNRNARPPARGFTLVELLVVIGIIALLLALTMPALSMARQAARGVTCLSNARQLSASLNQYAADSRQQFPGYAGRWNWNYDASAGAYSRVRGWMGVMRPYYGADDVRSCPEADDLPAATASAISLGQFGWIGQAEAGTAATGWSAYTYDPSFTHDVDADGRPMEADDRPARGGLGANLFLFSENRGIDWYSFLGAEPFRYVRLPIALAEDSQVKPTSADPSRTPAFGDSVMPEHAPLPGDLAPASIRDPLPNMFGVFDQDEGMARVAVDRHRGRNNQAFVDGHAEAIPLADLWQLKWGALHGRGDLDPALAFPDPATVVLPKD